MHLGTSTNYPRHELCAERVGVLGRPLGERSEWSSGDLRDRREHRRRGVRWVDAVRDDVVDHVVEQTGLNHLFASLFDAQFDEFDVGADRSADRGNYVDRGECFRSGWRVRLPRVTIA